MKKILLFTVAAATAMAFTGCSQSSELADTESNNTETTQKAISFDTYLSKTTRAGAAIGDQTTETLAENGFGVLGYYTGTTDYTAGTTAPNFMYNNKVTGTTSSTPTTWSYSPVRYWPNNNEDKLSFFAYAPYVFVTPNTGIPEGTTSGIVKLTSNSETTAPSLTYTLASDISNSVDLLWGTKKGATSGELTNTNIKRTASNVGFTFKHALAKFGGDDNFIKAVVTTDDNNFNSDTTKITISSIIITSEGLKTTGTLDLTTGNWSSPDGKGTSTITISNENINEDIREVKDANITKAEATMKGLTATPTNVYTTNKKSYYFIPGSTPTLKVTVAYWVRTIDPRLAGGITNVRQEVTNSITFPELQANKKYNLVLKIGLNGVKFEAIVEDWATTTTSETQTIQVPAVLLR